MKTASISATKNQLSALLERVRQGETILITDHDRPVAKLVPIGTESGSETPGQISALERQGIVRRGHGKKCRLTPPPKPATGTSAVAALLEERETAR
jgi:prevent-host-death family protein